MKSNAPITALALASFAMVAACGQSPAGETTSSAEATEEAAAVEEVAEEPAEEVQAVAFADLTGDAGNGETVFALCRSCHVVEEGVNRVGPSLYNIVGRTAGSIEGFNYSEANANSGITWTSEQLFTYLEDPQATIPGTRMVFPGIEDAQDRADLVAYLESVSE